MRVVLPVGAARDGADPRPPFVEHVILYLRGDGDGASIETGGRLAGI